jgi:hypothetical protein
VWSALKSAVGGLLKGKAPRQTAASKHYRITNPYHSVSITPAPGACAEARELRARRFLSTEAPPLPLPRCTLATCRCGYRHHDDRRARARRRVDRFEHGTSVWSGVERRRSLGRRATDL